MHNRQKQKCSKCGRKKGNGFAECSGRCNQAAGPHHPNWSPEFTKPVAIAQHQPKHVWQQQQPNPFTVGPKQPQQPSPFTVGPPKQLPGKQYQTHDPLFPTPSMPMHAQANTDLFMNLVMEREQKHETEKADLQKKIKELEGALAESDKKSKATIRALDTEVTTLKAKGPKQSKSSEKGFTHNAWCNQCSFMGNGSSKIVGTRYKCIMCPNYDLCEACMDLHDACIPKDGNFADAECFHNIYHGFVRMPISHANDPRPLFADRSYVVPGSLPCDICAGNINRFRFHCIECNINFCETCELMGQHPVAHTRIKRIQLDQPAGHLQRGHPSSPIGI